MDRTHPLSSIGLADVEGVTHDSIRHGTNTLSAALDVTTGEVINPVQAPHLRQEFLGFLRQIVQTVLEEL